MVQGIQALGRLGMEHWDNLWDVAERIKADQTHNMQFLVPTAACNSVCTPQ